MQFALETEGSNSSSSKSNRNNKQNALWLKQKLFLPARQAKDKGETGEVAEKGATVRLTPFLC